VLLAVWLAANLMLPAAGPDVGSVTAPPRRSLKIFFDGSAAIFKSFPSAGRADGKSAGSIYLFGGAFLQLARPKNPGPPPPTPLQIRRGMLANRAIRAPERHYWLRIPWTCRQ
jgi:hypothetical protein